MNTGYVTANSLITVPGVTDIDIGRQTGLATNKNSWYNHGEHSAQYNITKLGPHCDVLGSEDKYTQLQKKGECFKIGIVSRKRLKLKPKCPRCDDNAPELYLLKKIRMFIDLRLLY